MEQAAIKNSYNVSVYRDFVGEGNDAREVAPWYMKAGKNL
jgi:hypothetical protein